MSNVLISTLMAGQPPGEYVAVHMLVVCSSVFIFTSDGDQALSVDFGKKSLIMLSSSL